ncbi:hypothetical protein AAHH88_00690 [Candidatus Hodgkinia cicadicola]
MLFGIQPTGCPHLGNLVCLMLAKAQSARTWVCCIADMHALTTWIGSASGFKRRIRLAAAFVLSAGCTTWIVYVQSSATAQSCLHWLVCCLSKRAELESASLADAITNAGCLLYPSLMASDVLACRATHLAVGRDQLKHLEYVNLISRRLNKLAQDALGEAYALFPVVELCSKEAVKLMSLQAPNVKMSKSDRSKLSIINVLDGYDSIRVKIARSKTDGGLCMPARAFDLHNMLGLANLVNVYVAIANRTLLELLARAEGVEVKQFKCWLAKLIYNKTRRVKLKVDKWLLAPEQLEGALASGLKRMERWSKKCVNHVKVIAQLV